MVYSVCYEPIRKPCHYQVLQLVLQSHQRLHECCHLYVLAGKGSSLERRYLTICLPSSQVENQSDMELHFKVCFC